ncbi:unnamed protein product, partial [Callosobruchus maculatus]
MMDELRPNLVGVSNLLGVGGLLEDHHGHLGGNGVDKSNTRKRNGFTIIQNHVIYCSLSCKNKDEQNVNDKDNYIEIIRELQQEIEEKNKYIDSLKKRAKAFEDDVIEIERSYNDEIKDFSSKIKSLEKNLLHISSENTELKAIIDAEKDIKQQKSFGVDTSDFNIFLVSQKDTDDEQISNLESSSSSTSPQMETVNTLEDEFLDSSSKTTEEMDEVSLTTKSNPAVLPTEPSPSPIRRTNTEMKRHKVLIYGDQYAKHFRNILELYLDKSNFAIEAFVLPNIDFEHATKNIFRSTISYGQNDYVIMMFNTNNDREEELFVAIYTRDWLAAHALPIDLLNLSDEVNFEVAGVQINNTQLITIYRSPDGDFGCFLLKLSMMLDKLNYKKTVIVTGDFNVKFNTQQYQALQVVNLFESYDHLGIDLSVKHQPSHPIVK